MCATKAASQVLGFPQRSTSSQGSAPCSYFLNSGAGIQLSDVGLKSSGEMLTRSVTHFCCDHGCKMSQSSSAGRLAVEDGESLRAWACGCNRTGELEVKMPQTWLFEQVAFLAASGFIMTCTQEFIRLIYFWNSASELTLGFFRLRLMSQIEWI